MKNIQENAYDLPSRMMNLRELMLGADITSGLKSVETSRYSKNTNHLLAQGQPQTTSRNAADPWLSSTLYL